MLRCRGLATSLALRTRFVKSLYTWFFNVDFRLRRILIFTNYKRRRSMMADTMRLRPWSKISGNSCILYRIQISGNCYNSRPAAIGCQLVVLENCTWSLRGMDLIQTGKYFTIRKTVNVSTVSFKLILKFKVTNCSHVLQRASITRVQYQRKTFRTDDESD